jgi:helicase HerA-like protein
VDQILLGKGEHPVSLLAKYGNRHGLVAGATGTGKTVSLMVMAEGFSRLGVPVFMADVKGDVAGLALASPVVFWDLLGESGHPVRATISEIGPTLLARILEINDTQAGVLALPPVDFARGRRSLLRRAGAGPERSPAHRSERPRDREHPGRRSAHPEAEALFELPLMAPLGTV